MDGHKTYVKKQKTIDNYKVHVFPCFTSARVLVPKMFFSVVFPQFIGVLHQINVIFFNPVQLLGSSEFQDRFQMVERDPLSRFQI
jgi:hypothetical protein